MGHLLDALAHGYDVLGFDRAAGGDEVFRDLVLARIIEPASKLDSLRVLEEAGIGAASYRTLLRRLPVYAKDSWRQQLSAACAAHARLGPASLVLYDVSTLYFETDEGDGFRESGFSKERRLEPQITIGLLTGAGGFPLMVSAFEGNKAETKTMLPVIESFMAAHQLPDVTVVADAGMVSRGQSEGDRGRGAVVHPRHADPARPLRWSPSGGASTPARTSPTGTSSPSPGPPGRTAAAATRSSTTSTGPTGPAGRCAASTSRSPRPRRPSPGSAGQAEPVHPAVRRHQERQPRARGQGPGPGRAEGLRHQPAGLPRRHAGHRGVRDRRLPPAVPDREVIPDGQARPAGPARSTTTSATPSKRT